MEEIKVSVAGINFTLLKYSNKGVIILVNYNEDNYRIKILFVNNHLEIEVKKEN
jgi:hypothetical protein